MKRDPSLAPFSRDHHVALVVAQCLRRASEPDAEDARDAFLRYRQSDGRSHFREEEEILLPPFARFADPDTPLVTGVLVDHVRIRQLAAEVASDTATPELLRSLGALLEQHVRREERELFPLIERAVPERELSVWRRSSATDNRSGAASRDVPTPDGRPRRLSRFVRV